jgi:hypothetical protein
MTVLDLDYTYDEDAEVTEEFEKALEEAGDAVRSTLAALDRLNRQSARNLLNLRTARQILAASNRNAPLPALRETAFK